MIPQNAKLFFNNYMMRAATKDKKGLIGELQIGTGGITYTRKSKLMYVQSCEEYQRRDPSRSEEALHPTWVAVLWQKVGLDVVYMPLCEGYRFLVVARCDLSGWVGAKPLRTLSSRAVADFLWEDVICRHGCFEKLIIDGGSENKDAVYTAKRFLIE